jgi:hypothetical protein
MYNNKRIKILNMFNKQYKPKDSEFNLKKSTSTHLNDHFPAWFSDVTAYFLRQIAIGHIRYVDVVGYVDVVDMWIIINILFYFNVI